MSIRSSFSALRSRVFGRRSVPPLATVQGDSDKGMGKRVVWLGHSHDSQYVEVHSMARRALQHASPTRTFD